ncbi:Cell division protein FtsZ [bioreactor metagenome]|uniref:Cell division protein FtsZ n=1 Tax=bioreactor metagenome TaxID=1076179 RepID=A0A644XH36_9ZZZZ
MSPLLETSIAGAHGVLINVTGSMDIGLEEVEQAATLVQEAVNMDAITIFGAQFDENLEDEIRVTVIATGFEKVAAESPGRQAAPVAPPAAFAPPSVEAPAVPAEPAPAAQQITAEAPKPLSTMDDPKPQEPEDDPFEDIFKIFSKRDE